MPSPLANIAEIASEGQNIVITTLPGIGTVSKALATLEAGGLSIAHLATSVADFRAVDILVADGDTLRPILSTEVFTADVLVFDGLERASHASIEAIAEVMNNRTLFGRPLPFIKSMVAISVSYDATLTQGLADLDNTVTINVR